MATSISSATCSPTSLQLRLAMSRCNWRWGGAWNPCFLVPARPGATTRRVRPVCANRRHVATSCAPSSSSSGADGFAGWSDQGEGGSEGKEEKKWLGGAVGSGLAGIVLFAGVAFAAVSLSKRSTPRPVPVMESLTAQQEVSLVTDDWERMSQEPSKTVDGISATDEGGEAVTGTESDTLPDSEGAGRGNGPSVVENGEQSEQNLPSSIESDDSDIAQSSSEPNSEIPNGSLIDHENELQSATVEQPDLLQKGDLEIDGKLSSDPSAPQSEESLPVSTSVSSPSETVLETTILLDEDDKTQRSRSGKEVFDSMEIPNGSPLEVNEYSGTPESTATSLFGNERDMFANNEAKLDGLDSGQPIQESIFSSSGIPAPSVVPPALQIHPGKVLVPAAVDQFQGQALTALQTLKVIEADVQPSDICSRREYARWLVTASGALSRNTLSKVYPAMYIENISELAFDDIMPNDPDFPSIQGLAEAGLISSKLSSHDLLSSSDETQGGFLFAPESPLSRQDLVSWKMALERRQLPEADKKILYELSGFRDLDRIHPDAWPALIADLSAGDQGIISLAFGCTRLFQPDKPVTKAQAAVALATGEPAEIVNEELTRIEAESVAENAVSTHNALVAQVERDINAMFEKELLLERKKTGAVEKMAEEALHELERLRSEREQNSIALMKERAAVDSEMELLSRLRREVEEQLEGILSNKAIISYEKDRITKMQTEAEMEKQEISKLQYELEVERKALSMARTWAEDEAKKAREHVIAIEEARDRWERQGIKVIVDDDLRQESIAALTWQTAGKQDSVDGIVNRAEKLVGKLKLMADQVKGKSKEVIDTIVQKVLSLIILLKEWASMVGREAMDIKDKAVMKADGSLQDLKAVVTGVNAAVQEKVQESMTGVNAVVQEKVRESMTGVDSAREKVRESVKDLQQSTRDLNFTLKESTKRLVDECRDGMGKLTQKFKT